MKILVTGSAGHLGSALVDRLRKLQYDVVGLDLLSSLQTTHVGSISDWALVRRCLDGAQAVFHAATLHKPHITSHRAQDFVDTNITGTLALLEEAVRVRVGAFIFTSTTSVFGDALVPPAGAPAGWITEEVQPMPKNIYGVTKAAAEDLCQLFYRNHGLPAVVLRTSRFFPEPDDDPLMRDAYADENLKVNEYLHRRVDIADVVEAHLLALAQASTVGFRKYIISATTPFEAGDRRDLRENALRVVGRRVPEYAAEYERRNWKMFSSIDRVYINERARHELGWKPHYDFARCVARLKAGEDFRSPVARAVGAKGYHRQAVRA